MTIGENEFVFKYYQYFHSIMYLLPKSCYSYLIVLDGIIGFTKL